MKTLAIAVLTLASISILACSSDKKESTTGSKVSSSKTAQKKGGSSTASSNQKAGGTAKGSTSSATKGEAERDGVTCDSELEGAGFCGSDIDLVFCSGGAWYVLDCSALDASAFCGYEESLSAVDCWVVAE